MKYRFSVNISGTIDIEANTLEEARAKIEDGYSLSDIDTDNIYENFLGEIKEE